MVKKKISSTPVAAPQKKPSPFNFETFSETTHRLVLTVKIDGSINFPKTAIDLRNKYCLLHYDREQRILGIQPVEKEIKGAFALRNHSKTHNNPYISSRSFMEHFQIEYSEKKNYAMEWDDDLEMFIVDLNKEVKYRPRTYNKKPVYF